ncbi:ROK family transcriptional regulator [Bacillus timonensis]|uniref:ROK family transcriptional regulator n=1 Tax=Bacillus timonensis TaxID=1033734 RepID=UPI0002E3174B|nr:ROK family transcriptional regulator [Bacillus timonensis]
MERNVGSNKIRTKNINRTIVLQLIRNKGPITKADLANQAKLTFTTVNNIVDSLIKEKLIYESGFETSSGGRKPVLLNLNSNRYFAVGVHFSLSHIFAMVLNFNNEIIAEYSIQTNSKKSIEIVIEQIKKVIHAVVEKSKINKSDLIGIGVAAPGPLDPQKGILLSPPNFKGWESVPLGDIIESHFAIPTFIEKDVNSMAIGEYLVGDYEKKRIYYLSIWISELEVELSLMVKSIMDIHLEQEKSGMEQLILMDQGVIAETMDV